MRLRQKKKGQMSSASVPFSLILTSFPVSATLTALLYYRHLLILASINALVSSRPLPDQNREILLLHQQLLILQRQLGRMPAYGPLEKPALLLAALPLSKWRLTADLLIVQRDRVLRWHQELVRRLWTFRHRR